MQSPALAGLFVAAFSLCDAPKRRATALAKHHSRHNRSCSSVARGA
jgi:hypothetical protein